MFYQPRTIDEALELKSELRERGSFIAGGTDIVVLMNQGKAVAENLIDLSHIEALTRIRKYNGRLELAGNVTYAQCARLPIPCLAQASLSVGGSGIRELGSIAGNLATASPAGDGSTALLALDAEILLRSVSGQRTVPVNQFFLAYRQTALAPDEIISKVTLPTTYRTGWAKIGKRGAVNISIVAAAVAITPERTARIALASAAAIPMRCLGAEAYIARHGLDPATARQAAEIARSEVKPIDDQRASADYRTHLSGVLVRRLLEELARP
ncbi:MAG: FAD binding domain-containing protein [Gammaproteobacteria bacterium]